MAVLSVNVTESTTSVAPGGNGKNQAASAGVASAVIFVIVFVVVIIVRRRMSHSNSKKDTSAGSSSEDGEDSPFHQEGKPGIERGISVTSSRSLNQPLWKDVDPGLKTVITGLTIDSDRLAIGRHLGKGQFGMVYEASMALDRRPNDTGPLTHSKVAVKSLKGDNLSTENLESFLREGLIMKDFHHKNVLSLIGVAFADQGIPLIILPYMAKGNLKKYIMKPKLMITVRELLQFGLQVGHGMAYLQAEKFVHRDLAARNCMIDEHLTVKVADFGLSRDIYTKEYYSSENTSVPLPVKWMALESLTRAVYTSKTDVWSYGVLLWELLTRGALPYPDIANWEVKAYIQAGNRLDHPPESPQQIYDLMLQCWDKDPNRRPDFKEVVTVLGELLHPRSSGADNASEDDDHSYHNLYMNIAAADSVDGGAADSTGGATGGSERGIEGIKKEQEGVDVKYEGDPSVKYTTVLTS